MGILALSLLLLSILSLAACESKAAKVKKLQDQYNAEYPAYAKDCLDPETTGSADLQADSRRDRSSRSQEKRTRSTVQATGRPSCPAPERDSRCTAVKPYCCGA